jgi:hypothetical protein
MARDEGAVMEAVELKRGRVAAGLRERWLSDSEDPGSYGQSTSSA